MLFASQEASLLFMDLKLNKGAAENFFDSRHSIALGAEVLLSAARAPIQVTVALLSA